MDPKQNSILNIASAMESAMKGKNTFHIFEGTEQDKMEKCKSCNKRNVEKIALITKQGEIDHFSACDDCMKDIEENFLVSKRCNYCNSLREKLFLCGKCRKSFYCNGECQIKDWPFHKKFCG